VFPAAFSPLSELRDAVAQPSVADADVIRSVKNISKEIFSFMKKKEKSFEKLYRRSTTLRTKPRPKREDFPTKRKYKNALVNWKRCKARLSMS
jgi:hypothetical protein